MLLHQSLNGLRLTPLNKFYFWILKPNPNCIPVALLKRPPNCPPLKSKITEPILRLIPVPQTKLFSPPNEIPKYNGALVSGKNSDPIEISGFLDASKKPLISIGSEFFPETKAPLYFGISFGGENSFVWGTGISLKMGSVIFDLSGGQLGGLFNNATGMQFGFGLRIQK